MKIITAKSIMKIMKWRKSAKAIEISSIEANENGEIMKEKYQSMKISSEWQWLKISKMNKEKEMKERNNIESWRI